MKTRKRNRSPNTDCEDCLPISKRITRLQIQSGTRLSLEENEEEQKQSTSSSCHSSPEVQFPWQQQNSLATRPVEFPGNNNNLNYLPCSSQCDSSRTLNPNFAGRLSIQAYASHNGIDEEDLSGYNPELSVAQNPHYYHINNILYNAHIEKAKRYDAGCKFT